MSNSERGTGRTQRCIVRALSAGLRGETVIFVSGDLPSGKAHRAYAIRWLTDNGFIGHHNVDVSSASTILLGRGRVTFNTGESMSGPRLQRTTVIVEDHYVTECSARATEKAEREADKDTIAKLMHKHQWGTVEGYGVQFHGGNHLRAKLRLNLKTRTAE